MSHPEVPGLETKNRLSHMTRSQVKWVRWEREETFMQSAQQ